MDIKALAAFLHAVIVFVQGADVLDIKLFKALGVLLGEHLEHLVKLQEGKLLL